MNAQKPECTYTYSHLAYIIREAQRHDYLISTCMDYSMGVRGERQLVLRHDMDLLPARALQIGQLEADLGVRATYFVRLHANEYNALSHENLRILRQLAELGHEIGLHAEPVDLFHSAGVEESTSVRAGLETLRQFVSPDVSGVASHNDTTPHNNLDYLAAIDVSDLGGAYEGYDKAHLDLFGRSAYVTDGHFWYWRLFRNGTLTDDRQCLCQYLRTGEPKIYALIHPHLWFEEHAHVTELRRWIP